MSREYHICEICKQPRSKRVHSKCSKILQKMKQTPECKAERQIIEENQKTYDLMSKVVTNRKLRIRRANLNK